MDRKNRKVMWFGLLTAIVLNGTIRAESPVPTPSPVPKPLPTVTPKATPAPLVTPKVTPSPIAAPTPSVTPVKKEEKKVEEKKIEESKPEEKKLDEKKAEGPPPELPKPLDHSEVIKVDKRRNRVSITDDPKHAWVKKDYLCIERKNVTLACGRVLAVGIKGAIVQMGEHTAPIHPGDVAKYVPPNTNAPQISDENITADSMLNEKPFKFNFSLGYSISLDVLHPLAQFYWAVSPSVAVGLQAAYISKTGDVTTATLSGAGGSLTVNYFSQDYFRGFWVHLGSGFYRLTAAQAGVTEALNAPIVTVLLGWREDWAHSLNVGAGIGGRFLSPMSGALTQIKYNSLYPFAMVEVGLSF